MRRSFLVRVTILTVFGAGLLALVAKVVVERNGRVREAAPPTVGECSQPHELPELAQAARSKWSSRLVQQRRTDASSAVKLSPASAANPPEPAPTPPSSVDEVMAELSSVHQDIARLQFQAVMFESKGRLGEAKERRATLEDLKKRAATLGESVGLPPAEGNASHEPSLPP